jgi:predicted outer membrane protein
MMTAMRHHHHLRAVIAALPLMALPAVDDLAVSARDDAFIHQVMNGSKAEIRTAEAALKRKLTDAEREFAKQVIETHLTVLRELRVIATMKNISTRDEVQADEQGHLVTASTEPDKDFNAFFLKGEIASEGAEIAVCEAEIRDGTDADLTLFARTYLPGLQKCLVIAREFATKY